MIQSAIRIAALLTLSAAAALPGSSQLNPELETFFRQNIGLSENQVAAIRTGQAVTTALPPRAPAEVLLFGAVYTHANPETYFQFARNFDRLRKVPGFFALGVFTDPPQLSDLRDFAFDADDIQALGSEQAGLTGAQGWVVRKAAVSRAVSNLQNALLAIRNTLEGKQ